LNGKLYKIFTLLIAEAVSKPNHSVIPGCLPPDITTSELSAVPLSYEAVSKPNQFVIPACPLAVEMWNAFWQAGMFLSGIHSEN
jgi:hypothetical protein